MKTFKIKSLLAAALLSACSLTFAKAITDIAGRSVEVPDTVNKIALGEGRLMYAMLLLLDNPTEKIVAWRSDLIKNDPDTAKKLTENFPTINDLENLGDPYTSDVSLEALIKLKPDVYLLNIENLPKAKETGLLDKLDKAGIATIFVDFRQQPTTNTVPSMLVLGEVVNEQTKAMKFINYYRAQMALVSNRISSIKEVDRPLVFVESAAGWSPDKCCSTYGPRNFGQYVALAGGKNWGSSVSSGFSVRVNLETIFSQDFDVIIGTGGNWKAAYKDSESVGLGYYADPDTVQQQLQHLANRKGWPSLRAVKEKRFYSIYHQFFNSPYHFIAVQAFAKWLHPEVFADVDVMKNYQDFYDEFLPIDYSGLFWAELK